VHKLNGVAERYNRSAMDTARCLIKECPEKNKTWRLVDKIRDKKVIDVKWVYKRKSDNSCKARLVVRGFQQLEHQENVYSPVGKMLTLKPLHSFCTTNDHFIEQMDVETAFLNGPVKSEVYVNQL